MKQNQKGITIVGLLITVIVIVTIAGVSIYTGRDLIEEARETNLETNILLIQAAGKSLYDEKTIDSSVNLIGTEILYQNKKYYLLDKDNLSELGVNIKADQLDEEITKQNLENNQNVYIMNYETNDVRYLANVDLNNISLSLLPSEYQAVEYIKSTGTQYIDTEYIPKTNTKIDMELKFDGTFKTTFDSNQTGCFIGSSNDTGRYHINFGGSADQSNVLFNWIDKPLALGGQIYSLSIDDTTRTNRNRLIFKSGNVSYGTYNMQIATKTQNQTDSLVVLGYNISGSKKAFAAYNMYLYSFKLYEGDNIIRDFIPCYPKSNNEAGLYDLVEGKFYTNGGTGTFGKGNDV